MQNLDQQWGELQARYEQMSDEELQDLANEAYELTDMAKELLQSEIARRSLTEPPAVAGGAGRLIAVLQDVRRRSVPFCGSGRLDSFVLETRNLKPETPFST